MQAVRDRHRLPASRQNRQIRQEGYVLAGPLLWRGRRPPVPRTGFSVTLLPATCPTKLAVLASSGPRGRPWFRRGPCRRKAASVFCGFRPSCTCNAVWLDPQSPETVPRWSACSPRRPAGAAGRRGSFASRRPTLARLPVQALPLPGRSGGVPAARRSVPCWSGGAVADPRRREPHSAGPRRSSCPALTPLRRCPASRPALMPGVWEIVDTFSVPSPEPSSTDQGRARPPPPAQLPGDPTTSCSSATQLRRPLKATRPRWRSSTAPGPASPSPTCSSLRLNKPTASRGAHRGGAARVRPLQAMRCSRTTREALYRSVCARPIRRGQTLVTLSLSPSCRPASGGWPSRSLGASVPPPSGYFFHLWASSRRHQAKDVRIAPLCIGPPRREPRPPPAKQANWTRLDPSAVLGRLAAHRSHPLA